MDQFEEAVAEVIGQAGVIVPKRIQDVINRSDEIVTQVFERLSSIEEDEDKAVEVLAITLATIKLPQKIDEI